MILIDYELWDHYYVSHRGKHDIFLNLLAILDAEGSASLEQHLAWLNNQGSVQKCCWNVAAPKTVLLTRGRTHTWSHTQTPVQKPTNQDGFQDWLHYLICYDAQIHLESFSPHCCRCLDWSTCSKHVSGYLRHSVLKSLFRVSSCIFYTRYTKEQTRLAVVIAVWGFHSGDTLLI